MAKTKTKVAKTRPDKIKVAGKKLNEALRKDQEEREGKTELALRNIEYRLTHIEQFLEQGTDPERVGFGGPFRRAEVYP